MRLVFENRSMPWFFVVCFWLFTRCISWIIKILSKRFRILLRSSIYFEKKTKLLNINCVNAIKLIIRTMRWICSQYFYFKWQFSRWVWNGENCTILFLGTLLRWKLNGKLFWIFIFSHVLYNRIRLNGFDWLQTEHRVNEKKN